MESLPYFGGLMDTEKLKKRLKLDKTKEKLNLLSTGSTLLNLACSGKSYGGFPTGTYIFLVGDSTSGKSFLAMTCLAEAAKNPKFENYRFILDEPEQGILMDISRYFGKEVARRLERPEPSETVEDFYYRADTWLEQPCILILDSMDTLEAKADQDKFSDQKKAHEKGKEVAGSYGAAKAKLNSQCLRRLLPLLKKSGSILIIISQTRDAIGFGSMFQPKTRSGGRALRFYATLELWSSVRGKITEQIKAKKRQLGIQCQIEVKKNRLTGRERKVTIPILHSFGIDDIASCLNYLREEKYKSELLEHDESYIEENNLERELKKEVVRCWNGIEEACQVKRKLRYV
jgi:RecA/RadA recombinase